MALRPDPALAQYGWLPLLEAPAKLLVGEWLNIIQHPNGEPKQLALRENQLIDVLEQIPALPHRHRPRLIGFARVQ